MENLKTLEKMAKFSAIENEISKLKEKLPYAGETIFTYQGVRLTIKGNYSGLFVLHAGEDRLELNLDEVRDLHTGLKELFKDGD